MKKIFVLCMIAVLLCTGCGSNLEVTSEQNDLIAEYAAGILLKYSHNNQWKYYKLYQSKNGVNIGLGNVPGNQNTFPDPNNDPTQTPSQGNDTVNTDPPPSLDSMTMLSQGLNLSGATIEYSRYVVGDAYPEGAIIDFPAVPGRKVLAVEFNIKNTTSAPIVCTTSSENVVIKILVNGDTGVSQTMTILNNDIINLNNVTIEQGKSYTAAALFMIPEDKAANITSLSLSIAVGGSSAVSSKLL